MSSIPSPLMPLRSDFANEKKLLGFLAGQLRQGRLALFLGAGISVPFGLPGWPELLKKMFAAEKSTPDKSARVEKQAEAFRAKYYPTDHLGYAKAIHDSLYAGVNTGFDALRQNATLAAIGSLVMASRRGTVSKVATFNFDNILELYLAYHGYVVRSIGEERAWAEAGDVTVLHPHGLIPYGCPQESSSKIVFDRTSYAKVIGNDKNPWRQQLLCILRTHTCLFVGLSGDDDNLLSMLIDAKEGHASQPHSSAFWGVTFTTKPKDDGNIWESNRVFRKVISDFKTDLPRLLFAVCQEAAR